MGSAGFNVPSATVRKLGMFDDRCCVSGWGGGVGLRSSCVFVAWMV